MGKAQHESVTTQTRFLKMVIIALQILQLCYEFFYFFIFYSDVGESWDVKSSRVLGWSVEGIGF